MKSVTLPVVTVLFLIVLGSQSLLVSQDRRPRISYKIHVDAADLSDLDVEMRIRGAGDVVRIAMASHPEYDDRYWRYVENLTAESHGAPLSFTKEESALWRVVARGGTLTVKYRIHLPPQTTPTRAAWKPFLSPTGGLIGDLHSLMYVVGAESVPARVSLDLPSGWASASGLEPTNNPKTFSAASVELLLDSPIIIGQFQHWEFKVKGVPHTIVYWRQPNAASFDTVSFVAGIQRLVTEAFKFFGQAPYHSYTFLYEDGASGALEHLNSVNIYFGDLLLRRAQLPTFDPTRVAHLETYIAAYLLTPGYSRNSAERVSRASDDPLGLGDDFASTHLQGNLIGTMLDLMVRAATHGQRSLDDVMRTLGTRFNPQRGITGRDIEQAIHGVCACDSHSFFEAHVRGAQPLDFDHYLRTIGMRTQVSWSPALGTDGKPQPDIR